MSREREPLLHPNESILFVGQEITADHPQEIMALLADKDADPDVKQIYFYLDSPGGDLWASLVIAESMRRVNKPVNTIVVGRAYSGACLIAAAGTPGRRGAWETADFMLHELGLSDQFEGPIQKLRKMTAETEIDNTRWLETVAHFTSQPIDKLRADLAPGDLFLTPAQAKRYGIIDKIIKRLSVK